MCTFNCTGYRRRCSTAILWLYGAVMPSGTCKQCSLEIGVFPPCRIKFFMGWFTVFVSINIDRKEMSRICAPQPVMLHRYSSTNHHNNARPEFLKETTPYFKDRDVAILQTPQFFRYREEQTWVEKGAGVTQELFYRMVQVSYVGVLCCFNSCLSLSKKIYRTSLCVLFSSLSRSCFLYWCRKITLPLVWPFMVCFEQSCFCFLQLFLCV